MTALQVVFSEEAEADLFELFDYIAANASENMAGRFIDRIEALCMSLSDFPERGTPRDDIAPGIRTRSFEGRAMIVYRVEGERVRIWRVIYAGRDLERELGN